MEREKPREIANQERKENLNGYRILYRFSDDQEGDFRTAHIRKSASDEVNEFVRLETQRLREKMKEKSQEKTEISKRKKHGQKRSRRQLAEIGKGIEKEINLLNQKREILSGEANAPIILTREGDEITGSDLHLSYLEDQWWKYVKDRPRILEKSGEDYQFLLHSFTVRHNLKYKPTSEFDTWNDEWREIIDALKSEKKHLENEVVKIVSFVGKVTKSNP